MTLKHSPGPWKDGPVFQKEGRAIFITDQSKPGKWQKRLDDKSGVFSAEDARLIAAAPDLLAALKLTSAVIAGESLNKHDLTKALEAARHALTLAEGKYEY